MIEDITAISSFLYIAEEDGITGLQEQGYKHNHRRHGDAGAGQQIPQAGDAGSGTRIQLPPSVLTSRHRGRSVSVTLAADTCTVTGGPEPQKRANLVIYTNSVKAEVAHTPMN